MFQHHPVVLAGGNAKKITVDSYIKVIKRVVKRDEMRGLPRILSLFRGKFYKEVLAIRRLISLADMITNTKFSNCHNVFKLV